VRTPGGGVDAAHGIGERSPETKVIALSAHDDRTTVLEMLEAGVVGYLVKGTSIESIVESIEQAAVGQNSLSVEVAAEVIDELLQQRSVHRQIELDRRRQVDRIRCAIDDERAHRIVFQPICSLAHRTTVGYEALSRFAGPPQRTPDLWFDEAASVGLGVELEAMAARRALANLPDLPANTYLAFNTSPEAVGSKPFQRLFADTELERVVIEITERKQIDDYVNLNAAISGARERGARLAIDDAGAGFASLRHILMLAPDFIKLDRTLTAGIEHDRSQQALAAGLICFAEKIGSTIIAEGIEREEQVAALAAQGVAYGQGFFLAKPMGLDRLATQLPAVIE
jgi:EAL domain-containing protein (putative c-di-GMP-specific phosphodiesterase class I)